MLLHKRKIRVCQLVFLYVVGSFLHASEHYVCQITTTHTMYGIFML